MSSSACCRLLWNTLAILAKIDSGTSRSTTYSKLSAYQHMLLVDLLVPLCKTHATSELSAFGPRGCSTGKILRQHFGNSAVEFLCNGKYEKLWKFLVELWRLKREREHKKSNILMPEENKIIYVSVSLRQHSTFNIALANISYAIF